jgi:hypothetical protein
MFYRTIIVAVSLLGALSASSKAGIFTDHLPPRSGIKTVAIISAIGDTFMFEHIRTSPLQWLQPPEASFLEISDWGLDALVTHEAADLLSKKFHVKPVIFDEADFDTWTWSNLLRDVDELPPPMDTIDAYVVILRDWRGDEIGKSVQQLAGLGFYRRDTPGSPRLGIFASYRIVVLDARSPAIVASLAVLAHGGELPWSPATADLWPNTQNDMTDGQRKTIQVNVRRLIENTLRPALDEITGDR